MHFENILPAMRSAPWSPIEFPASLVHGDNTVPCTVTLDPHGATINIKQGNIVLPSSDWAIAFIRPEQLSIAVLGWDYNDWINKLKFEAKHPGQSKDDIPRKVVKWEFTLSPKKLGPDLFQKIQHNVHRTEIENYLQSKSDPDSIIITRCPTCSTNMDITPYADCETIYCNHCSRFLSPKLNVDDLDYGICQSCDYYTKLKSNNAAKGIADHTVCFGCHAKMVWKSFLITFAIALGIGLLNVVTIVFADRFFPILLFFAGVSFLWSMMKLASVITVSLARTATGVTPLEKATAAVKKGRAEEALKYIESVPDATSNPGILLNMARGLINAGDFQRALQFADLLVTQFPNFLQGFVVKMEAMAGTGASLDELGQAQQSKMEVASRNMLKSFDQIELITQMST